MPFKWPKGINPTKPITARDRARFWRRVHKFRRGGRCWIWTGGRADSKGYGRFWMHGAAWRVHRLSWFLHHGPIPPKMHVHHKCFRPGCVNPRHLCLLDALENSGLKSREREDDFS